MLIIDCNLFDLEFVFFQREYKKDSKWICWCGDLNCGGGLMGNFVGVFNLCVFDEFNRFIFKSIFGVMEVFEFVDVVVKKVRVKVEKFIFFVDYFIVWDDVVGNDEVKCVLVDVIEEFSWNLEIYKFYGMILFKGVFFYGLFGCGKMMFVKVVVVVVLWIYGIIVEVFVINGFDIQFFYVGVIEEMICNIFVYVNEYWKVYGYLFIVFIDEVDVIFFDCIGKGRCVVFYEEVNVVLFFVEMDGFKENGVFIIFVINWFEMIDEVFFWDGCCDWKIKVEWFIKVVVEQIFCKVFSMVLFK